MKASKVVAVLAVLAVSCGAGGVAVAGDPLVDCLSDDNGRRIEGCSAMIDDPQVAPEQRSFAYGMRALAYSLRGGFDQALADYDRAIDLNPDYAVALNNRAWVYFKLGRGEEGERDVERALQLSPGSPYALDTRAHIRQADGDAEAALADYQRAMRNGGDGHGQALSVRAARAGSLLRDARRYPLAGGDPRTSRLRYEPGLRSAPGRRGVQAFGLLTAAAGHSVNRCSASEKWVQDCLTLASAAHIVPALTNHGPIRWPRKKDDKVQV